jgi:hypothetical protein
LNWITDFAASGGLGEAASWVSLRQDIYVSVTTNTPLKIHLPNYKSSMSFAGLSDGAWANQMVYIFAEIINATFESVEPFHVQRWYELDNAVETWFRSKPDMFSPLFIPSQQKKPDNQSEKEVFPGMWLLHPAHVVGMQYYYLARLLLVPSDSRKARLGFGTIRTWRETEVTLPLTLKSAMR